MSVTFDDLPQLTNLSKVFWPDEGYTKLDLLTYYQQVAPFLLPYLVDRPQAMCRRPDGWQGKEFYQRISRTQPKWIPTAPVLVERGRRAKAFVLVNDLRTLIWLVNFGCIDFNPWASRVGSIDRPDYMVIDLDPGDVPFQRVIEVVTELRRLLDRIEAPSYVKTSGKRGMHVAVPLAAKYEAWQVKMFGELVCALLHQRMPTVTTLDARAESRKGRIYLDHTRNSRGQALAAAYSVRPWRGATVSTPLKWSEVRGGLDPAHWTIETMPDRLARVGDLWAPVLGPGIALARCLDRLAAQSQRQRVKD
jgi:bifunctional non-homologous end joining protein LigD